MIKMKALRIIPALLLASLIFAGAPASASAKPGVQVYLQSNPSRIAEIVSPDGVIFAEADTSGDTARTELAVDTLMTLDTHYGARFGETAGKKSAVIAMLLAAGPGLFVHGLGHFYAHQGEVGAILLLSGIVSGAAIILNGVTEGMGDNQSDDSQNREELWAVVYVVGWAYDILLSPVAVHSYNNRLSLGIEPDAGSSTLMLKLTLSTDLLGQSRTGKHVKK